MLVKKGNCFPPSPTTTMKAHGSSRSLTVEEKEWLAGSLPELRRLYPTRFWVEMAKRLELTRGIHMHHNTLRNQINSHIVPPPPTTPTPVTVLMIVAHIGLCGS